MNTLDALAAFERGERPDQSTTQRLAAEGYIEAAEVTNHQTPTGQREFLFISVTEKGRRLLESCK
jgi:hypothetical protein